MNNLEDFLSTITEPEQHARLEEIFEWTHKNFPHLKTVIKWKQPMFTDHDTFIIAYSVSKKHLSIAPEAIAIKTFKEDIEKADYQHTDNIIKIRWEQEVDYSLLKKIIAYNINEKLHYSKFWRE